MLAYGNFQLEFFRLEIFQSSHRIFYFSSLPNLYIWLFFSSLSSPTFSIFLYLSFPVQFASDTLTYSSFHLLLSRILMQTVQSKQIVCSLSLFTITVSVGTQLSGRNWCCSSPVEAKKWFSKELSLPEVSKVDGKILK